MSGSLQRGMAILELLATTPHPLPLRDIAQSVNGPPTTVHRILGILAEAGFINQVKDNGDYYLSLKLASLGLIGLANTGINGVAQPILDRLATETGELVRLGVVEDEKMVFIAKAAVPRYGLRYDPDAGQEAPLYCTASGQAWLLNLSDEEALRIISRQGLTFEQPHGPNAPTTIQQFLKELQAARKRGYGLNLNSSMAGLNAIAVAITQPTTGKIVGALSLAGPSSRFTLERAKEFLPELKKNAAELSGITLYPTALLGETSPYHT